MNTIINTNKDLLKFILSNIDYSKEYSGNITALILVEIVKTKKRLHTLRRITDYQINYSISNLNRELNYIYQQYLHINKIKNLEDRVKIIEQIILKK